MAKIILYLRIEDHLDKELKESYFKFMQESGKKISLNEYCSRILLMGLVEQRNPLPLMESGV